MASTTVAAPGTLRHTLSQDRSRVSQTIITSGWAVFILNVLFIAFPQSWHASVRLIPLGLSALWIFGTLSGTRKQLKLSMPMWVAVAAQGWAIISFFNAYGVLHRQLEIGPQIFFLLGESLPGYAVAYLLYQVDQERAKKWIPTSLAMLLGLSALVGMAQWLNLPFGQSIANFYNLQLLGEGQFTRAQGLAGSLHFFTQEIVLLAALLGCHIFVKKVKPHYLLGMLLLVPVIFGTQGRAGLLGFALAMILFMACLFTVSKKWFMVALIVFSAGLFAFFAVYSERLFFVKNALTHGRSQFEYRSKRAWVLATDVFKKQPVFGVGPDAYLYRGRGQQLPDAYVQPFIVESAFLFMLSQFGIPGMTFLILAFVCGGVVCLYVLLNKGSPPECKQAAFVGLAFILSNLVSYGVDNALNQPGRNYMTFIMIGWVSAVLITHMPRKRIRLRHDFAWSKLRSSTRSERRALEQVA